MDRHEVNEASEQEGSWVFLHQGSPEVFIEALCADVMRHQAVNHPYLERLASADLSDMKAAIRDYCHQYYFYSAEFTSYLEVVIGGLDSALHRDVLRQNLKEEQGSDLGNLQSIPHTELFQRFRRAAGVTPDDYLFLTLHMECDDRHADDTKDISLELAEDQGCREALRFGVLSSLNLRSTFWDVMLAGAVAA